MLIAQMLEVYMVYVRWVANILNCEQWHIDMIKEQINMEIHFI